MNVNGPLRFVDIHCHLLPGIDDGAADWNESLAMARMAVADGIDTIVVTPHQLGNFRNNTARDIRTRTERLQRMLDGAGIGLVVLPGADVRVEPELCAGLRADEILTLGDRRRHVLLELPHEMYVPLGGLLRELAALGLVGVLSHPERNAGILDRPGVMAPLVDAGCLMQITAGSLCGSFGRPIKAFSENLVKRGLVHVVATDAHGTRSRRPLLQRAFDRVAKLAGTAMAQQVCCHAPARIAAGQDVPGGRAGRGQKPGAGWRTAA